MFAIFEKIVTEKILFKPTILFLILALFVASLTVQSQSQRQREQIQRRAGEQQRKQILGRFIDDVHLLFEVSGELVSFRVRPDMARPEFKIISDKSRELEKRASRIISFIERIAPHVKGRTDDLWIVKPLSETPTLDQQLTVILALLYRIEPKIEHLIELMKGESEPSIELEELQLEASLPYLVVGGMKVIKKLTVALRDSF